MVRYEFGGHKYVSNELDPRKAFHCSRRLSPVLTSFKGILSNIDLFNQGNDPLNEEEGPTILLEQKIANKIAGIKIAKVMEAAEPLMKCLADIPDEHMDYIIDACLAATEREDNGSWVPVWNADKKAIRYRDIGMVEMLVICRFVLTDSLKDFTSALQSQSSNEALPQAA